MIKASVKKPFTILVAVVMVIALGVVSLMNMTADLLPEFSLPYMIVITTYPGAGPEKVEAAVTQPMESALGTINGVKNISSSSGDNYSTVQLEFEDDTDMSAALVKVSNAINTVKSYLPAEAGTPTVMEISMDMMASTYLGVSYEGMDDFELSHFVEDEIIPYLERQNGVANVNSVGLVSQSIVIELDEDKIQDVNDRILGAADKAFADARQQLIDAKETLEKNQKKLDDSYKEIEDGYKDIEEGYQKIEDSKEELHDKWNDYYSALGDYNNAKDELEESIFLLEATADNLPLLIENKRMMIDGAKTAVASRPLVAAAPNQLAQAHDTIPNLYYISGNVALANPALAPFVITSQSAVKPTVDSYNAYASPTDLEPCLSALNGVYTAANAAGVFSPAGIEYIMNFDQLYMALGIASDAANEGLKTIDKNLDQIIGAYNGLREGAGLKKTTWTAVTLDNAKIQIMEDTWDGLWGSTSAYARATVLMLNAQKAQLEASKSQLDAAKTQLENADEQIEKSYDQLEDGKKQLEDAKEQLADAQKQIDDGWESYYDGVKQFNKQRQEVLKTANADQLVSLNTLSQLVYAQNFEMPAGYIDDENDNSWLIKIGQNFESAEDMQDIVLTYIDKVGDIRLSDVAHITYIDNVGQSYAKMNGNNSVLLAIFKSSTASTNSVSKLVDKAMEELQNKYDGLSVVTLLDQGDYIDMLVQSVLESMIIGAVLAVIILALFLKDVVPTLVVAISIPLSVLLAIVCMYFANITLNIMTLSGLALGIGMLVDNSIVVIENIYRIKLLGNSSAKASVLGASEVAGPIVSSTLTTICVFLPIMFATGMVKDLILPMCLTVTFCLVASLAIALTVVPAAGSTLLKNSKPKEHKWFDKVMDVYGAALKWCLKVKVVPLLIAIALLVGSVWQILRMGIVMIPEMATEPIQMTVIIPDEADKETAFKTIDGIAEKLMDIDGIETVGAMPSSALISTVQSGAGSGNFRNFMIYIMLEGDNPSPKEIKNITDQINAFTGEFDAEINLSAASMDTSALLGSGLSIRIYGTDLNKLLELSEDVMTEIAKVDGYENISNAQEEGDDVVHLIIDKDKAMSKGLSVAQIYADINTRLTEDIKSTTLTVNGKEMDVQIKKSYSVPKVENLLDLKFNVKEVDSDGDTVTNTYKLSDFATVQIEKGVAVAQRYNLSRYISVTADVAEGKNATLLARELKPLIENIELPSGYSISLGGESDTTNDMIVQMSKLMALGFLFIYLVMVAQFQSLLSPFIILFTIPLAFTGGLIALVLCREQLSLISIMGFMILMGTVVNNGIVFVDYTNQLRISGMERWDALIETGKTRMRPILMTALTTILAMSKMSLGMDMAGQMGKGMALVIMGGLLYATFMTLFIVPVIYDILFKKQPLVVDIDV